jgi:hypothetical protein
MHLQVDMLYYFYIRNVNIEKLRISAFFAIINMCQMQGKYEKYEDYWK